MYSVRLGYSAAISRIKGLLKNGHDAEALVTAVFTVEKTLRRTLRQLAVSSGFTSEMADRVVRNLRGLDAVKDNWDLYDPKKRKLTQVISQADWTLFKNCAEMRNKLVHGERVYDLRACRKQANAVILGLSRVKQELDNEYGYSGWTTASKRKSPKLHIDPKVRIRP